MDRRERRGGRIAQQLGMSHGSAATKLRKNILFSLLTRLEENVCWKCKLKIEKPDELSVEHIKPWENISADLFWDLSNVVFSHLSCNRPHINHGWKFVNEQKKVFSGRAAKLECRSGP